jgi:hypothetical protein
MNNPTEYSAQTIDRSAQNNVLGGVTKLLALDTIAKQKQAMQQQQAMQAQQQQPILAQLQQQAMAQGIDNVPSNLPQQYAGGGIIAFEEGGKTEEPKYISELPTYLRDKLGPFLRGLREQINTGRAAPGAMFNPAMQAPLTAPTSMPTDAKPDELGRYKADVDNTGIIIHPNAPRAATPTGGAPTPSATPISAYQPADTSGIDTLRTKYEDMIRGNEDYKQAGVDAEANARRKLFLGMMASKNPYLLGGIGEAGLAAQEGLEKTREGIQTRKDKQIGQLVALGLNGEELKMAAKKMGIDETELKAKLPLFQAEAAQKYAMANYYNTAKGKGAGAIGVGGSLGEATVDKIMERFDAYRQDYKNPNNPYVGMLSLQDQLYLKEGKGKGLATARRKLNELIDMEQQKRLNTLAGYKQKRPVSSIED